MNCRRARRLFGAYWDDEVTQAEREWLEAHFGTCGSCRAEYEQLARSLEWVGSLPREETPAGFVERTLARARRAGLEPDRVPGSAPRWIPVTAAAALLLVLAGSAIQWASLSKSSQPRPVASAPIPQPTWVGPPATARTEPAAGAVAAVPESLFDHSEDVEFILDPVTLRKGRAHTTIRGADSPRGQQATITF